MSELLEIEVDGRPPPKQRRDDGAPSWGMPVAIALAGVMLLAVALVVVAPAFRSAGSPAVQDANVEPRPPPPTALAQPRDEVVEAARRALSAWGEFATSGDVAVLAGHFHEDGPQYRQLADEAEGIAATAAPGAGYEVVTDATVETISSDRALLRATVEWRRTDEPDQRNSWLIEMRRSGRGESWALWTIRTAEP